MRLADNFREDINTAWLMSPIQSNPYPSLTISSPSGTLAPGLQCLILHIFHLLLSLGVRVARMSPDVLGFNLTFRIA
jgi:hypothetical protein